MRRLSCGMLCESMLLPMFGFVAPSSAVEVHKAEAFVKDDQREFARAEVPSSFGILQKLGRFV